MRKNSIKEPSQWMKVMSLSLIICLLSFSHVAAQKVGDIISGTVTDNMGPVMMANVVEIDASNRIVASAVTDMNGNFSFKLKNPKDKLRVSFVGYKTVTLPINKTKFALKMSDATQIREVTVTSKKKAQGSGLAIPVDEISTARQSIDMKEFEGLAITSVDEVVDGIEDTRDDDFDYALAYDPTGDRLHFGSERPEGLTFMVNVYDQGGRLMRTFRASEECSLRGLPRGLYIVSWKFAGKRRSVKFIK